MPSASNTLTRYSGVQCTKKSTDRVWSRRCRHFYAADRLTTCLAVVEKNVGLLFSVSTPCKHPGCFFTLRFYFRGVGVSHAAGAKSTCVLKSGLTTGSGRIPSLPRSLRQTSWASCCHMTAGFLFAVRCSNPHSLCTYSPLIFFFLPLSVLSSPLLIIVLTTFLACLLEWEAPPSFAHPLTYLSRSFNQPLREDELLSWLAVSCILAFHSTQEEISRVASNMVSLAGSV